MKKYFLFFFLIPKFIFSAPAGNPSLPSVLEEGFIIPDTKIINLRAGYQIYNSPDLIMKFNNICNENEFHLRKVKAFCNSGLISLNIKERLDIYTEIGSYRLEPQFVFNANLYNAKSENNILLRAGTRLIFIEISNFSMSVDVKYSFFKAASSYLTQNEKPVMDRLKFRLNEWQIAAGISQKISILRPYIGVAYRDTRILMNNFLDFENLKMIFKKKAGMFLGCSASLGSYVLVNGEIRLVNERAIIISGELRF